MSPIVLAAAKKASVPVCFHLDHGAGLSEATRALRYGASGIMIDKSALPLDENITETKKIVDMCNAVGVAVEGESGHVGSVNDSEMQEFTKVDEAKEFVEKTGITALAILVGTAHGRYKKAPKLDIESAAKALFEIYSPETVVITDGKNGGILYDGETVWHYPSFPVEAVDSNGAGDVFHGAFAFCVQMGYSYKKCCIFSSAVSALKCTGIGARESVPEFNDVINFLKEREINEL